MTYKFYNDYKFVSHSANLFSQRCAIAVISCKSVSLLHTTSVSKRLHVLSWFWYRGFPRHSRNEDISKNNGTSLCDFVPNCGVRKFGYHTFSDLSVANSSIVVFTFTTPGDNGGRGQVLDSQPTVVVY